MPNSEPFIAVRVHDNPAFYLCGTRHGDLGKIQDGDRLSDAYAELSLLVGPCGSTPTDLDADAPLRVTFAAPIRLPGALVNVADPANAFIQGIDPAALAALEASVRARLIAGVREAGRRMGTVEVDARAAGDAFLGLKSPFLNGQAFAGASASLQLWAVADAPAAVTLALRIELTAYTFVKVGTAEQSLSIALVLVGDAQANLRLGVADLGLKLPPFDLPSFDFSDLQVHLLPLQDGLRQAASSFAQYVADVVEVTVTHKAPTGAAEPQLAVQVSTSPPRIDWAVVSSKLDEGETLAGTNKMAQFDVTIREQQSGLDISVNGLELAAVHGRALAAPAVTATQTPIRIDGKPRRLGPFDISWREMTVTPLVTQTTASAAIAFQRLTIAVHDDAAAFLCFDGQVEVSDTGIRLVRLALVEPYSLALVEGAASTIRSAAAVFKVVLDLAKLDGDLNQAKQFIAILGRMALAAGRALVFIGEHAADAFDALGDWLGKGLSAVAETLGSLLGSLDELLASAAGPKLALELRFATQPFELRQVMVTSRKRPAGDGFSAKLLGVSVDVRGEWRPALLIDLVALPGAYLVLLPPAVNAGGEVARLSTDLWLSQGGSTSPMRDASGAAPAPASRDKATPPLLELTVNATGASAAGTMVVLAGIARGEPVFFKYATAPVQRLNIGAGVDVDVASVDGPFTLAGLDQGFDLDVTFQPDRILPLLGMGDTGEQAQETPPEPGEPSFLDKLKGSLANVVWVKETSYDVKLEEREATVNLTLGVKAAGLETSMVLEGSLDLDTLSLGIKAGKEFEINSRRIEENALGLVWIIEQKDDTQRNQNLSVPMFKLGFADGQSGMELNKAVARMQLRFDALSSDGRGLVFDVDTFRIGPGGLDLTATVSRTPVRLNGVDVPFHFTEGKFDIRGGRLVEAKVAGRGALPPALVGEVDCSIALAFAEVQGEGIVLQSGKVNFERKNDPVICHASRFTLSISDLDIGFVKDGGYHFYYLVTGSLRFTPKPGEFQNGLLKFLDGIEMNLERTPLSSDPRVLLKHISFQKTLNPRKEFNLFNLFTFELRGFGYHPASPKFGGDPAVNLSGQIRFVEMGDVMQPSIDFHGLWIAPPKDGEALPRIKADGLGIDLNMKGSIRVRGAVIAVDRDTRTVEGSELAPPEYNASGFLGRGEFDIPGWGTMGASLGFLELEKRDDPGVRRKAFYFFADKKKLAIEIPTPIWTFYLREAGFGLGFRYTLSAIDAADRATSVPKLISALDEAAKTQGDLHKFSAWKPQPEGDKVTLALKGVIQAYPASKTWNEEQEAAAQNPFLFDLVAAIRSDFTLFMGMRGWIGANYLDYLNDDGGMRAKPGLRGYLFISAPQQRLLARMIGDSKGYIGKRIPALAENSPMRKALQSVDWSATLFIKPGLFHYELGWPNQLAVRLFDEPNLRVTVRGGMIFRAAEDGLLWAYNIEADAWFHFSGSLQAGPIGVCAEATLTARLVARVLAYLTWRVQGSLIYGLVSLDARLDVSFRAWLKIDLRFTSYTIRIGFSATLQFSAAVEVALSTEGVGARVAARVGVSVFGTTFSVAVGFTLGEGQLDQARERVQRFMAMSITAEEPDAPPAQVSSSGDERLRDDARHAEAPHSRQAEALADTQQAAQAAPKEKRDAHYGKAPGAADFWCVIHRDMRPGFEGFGYAMLIPKQADRTLAPNAVHPVGFFAPARAYLAGGGYNDQQPAHTLEAAVPAALPNVSRVRPDNTLDALTLPADIRANWNKPLKTEGGGNDFTLGKLVDECYLTDADWNEEAQGWRRTVTTWNEPPVRLYERPLAPTGGTDEERSAQRDKFQRDQQASAAARPIVDGVHQARSTVLAMFADQFAAMANGDAWDDKSAHLTDLGLVFYGELGPLEALHGLAIVRDLPGKPRGRIELFNPVAGWFAMRPPKLDDRRFRVVPDGVRLDWSLLPTDNSALRLMADVRQDPEHHLQHYEIVRTVEGQEFTPVSMLVKPAATLGKDDGETVQLLAPEWQFSDNLADLPPDLRRALLPGKDGTESLAAAQAWASRFGSADTCTLTYTVTPIDIAGSRGGSKSYRVDIRQRTPPLRPAEAELRFVIRQLGSGAGTPAPYTQDQRPPDDAIGVVMGLRDRHGGGKVAGVERYYVLYADPENISPSGSYGTDGLTERRLGLPSIAEPGADVRRWRLDPKDFETVLDANDRVPDDSFMDALEPDHDTLAAFPLWSRLAGATGMAQVDANLARNAPVPDDGKPADFLQSLWRRGGNGGPRIATRFTLETVQEVTVDGNKVISRSQRMPVNIEVRIEPLDTLEHEIGLLRPEAFEWPVHLELPPHREEQVRVSTGFARFRVPRPDSALADLAGVSAQVALVRDAERRILTRVSFDAAPHFDGAATNLDQVHASCVAGFDVHELDMDELARLDTDAALPFDENAVTWARARRIARVERISPAQARLVPEHNKDWQGWQAHYPSETWRLDHRADARAGASVPRRAPWYSAAESTIALARRVPRMRLWPTAPEAAVSALLDTGLPGQLRVTVAFRRGDAASEVPGVKLGLAELAYGEHRPPALRQLDIKPDPENESAWLVGIPHEDEEPAPRLDVDDVRAALLRLVLLVPPDEGQTLAAAAAAGAPILCRVTVQGRIVRPAEGNDPARPDLASTLYQEDISLFGPVHAILEEAMGELEYSAQGALFRRYVVSPQAVQPIEATDLAGFLSSTSADNDPYGWGALHKLGLARTLRIYDRDDDAYLAPRDLVGRVDRILLATVRRYAAALGAEALGQAFAEVLLRPGQDRVPGPFDAVLLTGGKESESDTLDLDDAGLSMVQLSLRPRPKAVRNYRRLSLVQEVATWPETLGTRQTGDIVFARSLLGYELEFASSGAEYDLLSLQDGQVARVTPAKSVRVRLPAWRKGKVAKEEAPEIRLFLRTPSGAFDHPEPVFLARVRLTETNTTTNTATAQDKLVDLATLAGWSGNPATFPKTGFARRTDEIVPAPAGVLSPYEQFTALEPGDWAPILKDLPEFAQLGIHLGIVAPALNWLQPAKGASDPLAPYREIAPAYGNWSQRFLTHAAEPETLPAQGAAATAERIHVALAAPTKANPLHLASDANGEIALSFLHADRWAHVRAYAVRPTPRYQNLALGAGYYASTTDSERLVTPGILAAFRQDEPARLRRKLGYALAVSPRTERIEPPVFLGSRMVPAERTKPAAAVVRTSWELVLARHGEEELAMSNRSLFARLGTEGTALSFLRTYRHPAWPDRLRAQFRELPPPELYPEREAGLADAGDERVARIDDEALGALAGAYPSLWRGADAWRIGELPAHYRVSALAVARAGLVVSRVVASTHERPPRRPLHADWRGSAGTTAQPVPLLGAPTLVIEREGNQPATIGIQGLRLVTHADVSEAGAHAWFGRDRDDIAWWPDPDVRYSLLRRGVTGGGLRLEDEDAEIVLVARQPAEPTPAIPAPAAPVPPIVVRCRGTRFGAHGLPALARGPGEDFAARAFQLGVSLVRLGADTELRQTPVAVDPRAGALNAAAGPFARILQQVELDVGPWIGLPADRAAAQDWLRERAKEVRAFAGTILAGNASMAPVATALTGLAGEMEDEATQLGGIAYDPATSTIGRTRFVTVKDMEPVAPEALDGERPFDLVWRRRQLLEVRDLPIQAEYDGALASGHPAAVDGGLLWRLCRERLLGSASEIVVRAVDSANALDKAGDGPWAAIGATEQSVALPTWAQVQE